MKPVLLSAFLLYLIISFSLPGFGQQGNNWYFGNKAGLTFNTSPSSALLNGQMQTNEGCAAISDNNGDLLFYTDGINVWNKLHKVMPNGSGLKGNSSSSNSAIVIPKPGSNSIYYIFTADAAENDNALGYNYSEVDMTLNGGLGDITINKNIFLYAPSSEQLTAARSSNGIDIWIITKEWNNDQWDVFKIDCNGVNTVPIKSFAGKVRNALETVYINGVWGFWNVGSVGCTKVSPDGKKLAVSDFSNDCWEIFDFDNNTGIISNPIVISQKQSYGIEFSPNSKVMYVTSETPFGAIPQVIQYDLTNYDSALIASSAVVVGSGTSWWLGALQLGPDGKIYCAMEQLDSLAVINSPNTLGLGCGFVFSQTSLKGRACVRGLPVVFPSLLTNQNVDISFGVGSNCSTVHFSGKSTITGPLTWSWDFGDGVTANGQNVSHNYTPGGTNFDTVRLTVTAPSICGIATAKATKLINLNRITPSSKFGFSVKCGDPLVSFSDSTTISGGTIQSWLWDFGDGATSSLPNPVHLYNGFGNYPVKLSVTSNGNCNGMDIATATVPIEAKPVGGFSNTKTCVNSPVGFTDLSTIAAGTLGAWYWDFGDGSNSTLQTPVKLFNAIGSYNVKMVVTSSTGCVSDTVSKLLTVSSIPVALFSVKDTCYGSISEFNGSASVNNGSISGWWWWFGDGNNSVVQNASNSYAQPGKYLVQFLVTANTGCQSDTISRIITIGSKPTAQFTFDEQCGSLQIPFTDGSTNANEPITQWHWDFGDGGNAANENPNHSFRSYGLYNTNLVVISSLGCLSDTIKKNVAVSSKPKAQFSYLNGCENQIVSFKDSSINMDGSRISNWFWDLGDGKSSAVQFPMDSYNSFGNYSIRLAVTSENNCSSDTLSKTITIEPKPVSLFSVNDGCVGNLLDLTDKSSISFGTITAWWWNFGDGDISTQKQPFYSFSQYGDFEIKQVVISHNGCKSDTTSQKVNIESVPIIGFNFGNTCVGKQIDFSNLSSNQSGDITKWEWDFGNGDISNLFAPSYTYRQYGVYSIKLSATTLNGCQANGTKTISIDKVNVFAGNDTTVAIDQPLQLIAIGAQHYVWSPSSYLSDPLIGSPIAILPDNMTYFLQGTTSEGCVGYDTINIKVYKGPEIYVPNAFTPNGDGRNEFFKPILVGNAELYYFSVFNRWGQLIYTTNQSGKGWDGKLNGYPQPSGTYVWIVKAKNYLGNVIEKKGTVVLVR